MARLNEQPAPAESHLEILRRKFLRQNRDIAKINSDQSQKIRRLENDCARLLSENLELRGQILRLEKQLEDNSARRIADHALEVKAKLELQLSEFAALLGTLGVEPPSKRRSSGERTLAKPRPSVATSPPRRRRRDTTVDAETLAEQEGRLPPIYENKTYPRATMNSEEILALCAAAADTSDSPDLGPPPVSRFVDEDAVQHDSPAQADVPDSPKPSLPLPPLSPLNYDRVPSRSPEPSGELEGIVAKQATPSKETSSATPSKETSSARQAVPEPVVQPIRAGAKRKYGDDNEPIQRVMVHPGKENDVAPGKTFPARGGQKRRSIKDLSSSRREKGGARVPLATKSTNADLSSPLKSGEVAPLKEVKKEQEQDAKRSIPKGEANVPKSLPRVEIPAPETPAIAEVLLEAETALPLEIPTSPSTPDHARKKEVPHDTPPPADISSTGETSRPSRRARAPISYAEPNLRDKMRRPTKQLFDAVTGEGKFVHRVMAAKLDDRHTAPTSVGKVKAEPGSAASRSSKTSSAADPTVEAQQRALVSPLAQKDGFSETLPSTVVTERRKRPSAVGSSRESLVALNRSDGTTVTSPTTNAQPGNCQQSAGSSMTEASLGHDRKQQSAPGPSAEVDIYDFSASSPAPSTTKEPSQAGSEPAKPAAAAHSSSSSSVQPSRTRTARKSSMAAAAALRTLLDEEAEDAKSSSPPPRPRSAAAHARKRASMLAPKKSSMLDALEDAAEDVANTSGSSAASHEGDAVAKDRISRRRSMML
ncbi:uncharacterized protein THITE_2123600 [Thermothielavioides terrestris NRRL 8126]|uniref:Shugoshin C-terminal domain-containing protein n=1 Tax=Thermothielavioides terrestris (strain ATCC 38088 / NRRL 8126) TaxID=578455 RepID=G2RHP3_THETT|nr:uncharacterized protein THITE_2123600 [Thermothielavioides terrestris NRRL 8126]AEO71355.1 hypothetical protein THITE_2123600 [Thermothielavioides terrestris NRRL 8126]